MTLKSLALGCAALALAPAASAASVVRAEQTTAQFQQVFDSYFTKPGKHLVTLDAYRTPAGMRYVYYGVEEDRPAFQTLAELDGAGFQKAFNEAAKNGLGLVDISITDTPSGPLFAGIWEAGVTTASRGNLTQGDLNNWQVEAPASGDVPIDLECYGADDDPRYAVIWKHDPGAGDWKMEYGLSGAAFQERYNLHVDEGYRLVQVDVCSGGDAPRYGGIFVKSDGRNWFSKGDLSSAELLKAQTDADSQGYRLLSISGYLVGANSRFSAVWAQ